MEINGGSLENVAEDFVLFLCGVQLVLGSGVLTILDLDEVDVTPVLQDEKLHRHLKPFPFIFSSGQKLSEITYGNSYNTHVDTRRLNHLMMSSHHGHPFRHVCTHKNHALSA